MALNGCRRRRPTRHSFLPPRSARWGIHPAAGWRARFLSSSTDLCLRAKMEVGVKLSKRKASFENLFWMPRCNIRVVVHKDNDYSNGISEHMQRPFC